MIKSIKEGLKINLMGSSANGTLVAAELIPLRKGRKTRRLAIELGKEEIIPNMPNGAYLLRLRLPNGGTIARKLKVEMGEGEQTVYLDSHFSPNETAAWGYLVQPARRSMKGMALHQLFTRFKNEHISPGMKAVFDAADVDSAAVDGDFTASFFVQRQAVVPGYAGPGPWLLSVYPGSVNHISRQTDIGFSASRDPNAVAEFRMISDGQQMPVMMMEDPASAVVATCGSVSTFAFLPPDTTRLLVIYDPKRPQQIAAQASPWNLMPDVGDPHALVLYNYLVGAQFNQARLIADKYLAHAVAALEAKFTNLSAALIGGYYLLKMTPPWTRKRTKIAGVAAAELTKWLRNLDERFDYCADGAIINGSEHLRCGRVGEARERLLEAARRGMPCSTLGARMLLDGLKLLAYNEKGERDPLVEAALEVMRPLYASVDWSSAFSTVRGSLGGMEGSWHLAPAELHGTKPAPDADETMPKMLTH